MIQPQAIDPIPEETVRVARAAFPKGNLYMGYEDLNNHEELRHDPMFAIALKKRIGTENEPVILAGKSTLNRLEHCPNSDDYNDAKSS